MYSLSCSEISGDSAVPAANSFVSTRNVRYQGRECTKQDIHIKLFDVGSRLVRESAGLILAAPPPAGTKSDQATQETFYEVRYRVQVSALNGQKVGKGGQVSESGIEGKTTWSIFILTVVISVVLASCGGYVGTTPPPTMYTIGGTVSGLSGTGLVLQDNGGNNLPVSAGELAFHLQRVWRVVEIIA